MTHIIIKAEDLDFSGALKVISSTQKFVIPVPAFPNGGEPLEYPASATDKNGQPIGGNPITDWEGKSIGEAGVVFFNNKDKSWQAASGDGSAVIIINEVPENTARILDLYIRTSFAHRPNLDFSVDELKQILSYAQNNLFLSDMYNSDQKFIASKMSRASDDTSISGYGLYKRDDRDVCEAVYITGKGEFQGPAATPQQFEDGAVIVRQGESVRLIQPEIFTRTYRQANGSKLKLSDVPSVITEGTTSAMRPALKAQAPKKTNG